MNDHKDECPQDCNDCESSCDGRKETKSFIIKPHPWSNIKKVIGIASGKGGVGKTYLTSLMAVSLKKRGYKVGILDANITGSSIPNAFGVNSKARGNEKGINPVATNRGIDLMSMNFLMTEETDPIIRKGSVAASIVNQFWSNVLWGDKDFLLIDLPSGTDEIVNTVFQAIPLNGIVIVSTPQRLAVSIVEKTIKLAKEMNLSILGIVENMSYYMCKNSAEKVELFGESWVDDVAQKYTLDVLLKLPISKEDGTLIEAGRAEDINNKLIEHLINKIITRL